MIHAIDPKEVLPSISIVFVNFNGLTYLGRLFIEFLKSLAEQDYKGKIEIIAVDNASTDNSTKVILKQLPYAKVIKLNRNIGYVNAVNIAVKNANGDYILVLNNDVILPRNFISKIIARLREIELLIRRKVVLVPLQVVGRGNRLIGTRPTINVLGQALHMDYLLPRHLYLSIYEKLPWCWRKSFVDGAAFIFHRVLLNKIKGILFIPFFKMYFDDVELGIRLNLLDVPIISCKDIVIYHRLYSTSGRVIGINKYINYNINRLTTFLATMGIQKLNTIKKLLLTISLFFYDTVSLMIISLKLKTNPISTIYRYMKELSRVHKLSKILENYYYSIGISQSRVIYTIERLFEEFILIPKWLINSKVLFNCLKNVVPSFVLLIAAVMSKELRSKYKHKGVKYVYIETLA